MTRLVSEALGAEIRAGRIGVGDLLPTEATLAREFDVSRHTVREALRVLRDRGLITSRQGMGSRVRSASPHIAYVEAMTSVDDVLEYAAATHLKQMKLEDVVADAALAETLGSEPGRRWLRVTGLRVANDDETPICWADLYLDAATFGAGDLIHSQASLFQKIEAELLQDVEVRQEIAVASVPSECAQSFGVEPGHGALRVVRTYVDRYARPFLVAINLHPADRYTYRTVLVRRREAPGESSVHEGVRRQDRRDDPMSST